MRPGKITQTAWNRFIRKKIHKERSGTLFVPSPEENCSGIPAGPDGAVIWSDAAAVGDSPRTVWYAALQAAGNLAARGASPRGISLRILFPGDVPENMLSAAAEAAQDICGQTGTELTCFHGEANSAVQRTVALAVSAGTTFCGGITGGMSPGQEILLCGYAGLEGTLRILDEAEEELAGRFVPGFLAQTRELWHELVMPDQIADICKERTAGGEPMVSAVRQIGSGGILAALWELADISGAGLEVSMEAMALKQETVEICEYYQINPYQMTSAGSYLVATDHAEELMHVLEKAGVRAGRLGIAKAQNARVITGGEEKRYLDRPAPDSLACWWEGRPFKNNTDKQEGIL